LVSFLYNVRTQLRGVHGIACTDVLTEKRRFFTFSLSLSLFFFFFQQVRGQSTPLDASDESQVMILKKEANGCCDGFFFFSPFFKQRIAGCERA